MVQLVKLALLALVLNYASKVLLGQRWHDVFNRQSGFPYDPSLSTVEYFAAMLRASFAAAGESQERKVLLTPAQLEAAQGTWPCRAGLLYFAAAALGFSQAGHDQIFFRQMLVSKLLAEDEDYAAADAVLNDAAGALGYRWSEWVELAVAARRALGPTWTEPSKPHLRNCTEEWSILRFLVDGNDSEPTGAWSLERGPDWIQRDWHSLMDGLYGPVSESEPLQLAGQMEVAQLNQSTAVVLWVWPFQKVPGHSADDSMVLSDMLSHPFRIQDGSKEPSYWRLTASWGERGSCLQISIIPEHPLQEQHEFSVFTWWVLADQQGELWGGADQGQGSYEHDCSIQALAGENADVLLTGCRCLPFPPPDMEEALPSKGEIVVGATLFLVLPGGTDVAAATDIVLSPNKYYRALSPTQLKKWGLPLGSPGFHKSEVLSSGQLHAAWGLQRGPPQQRTFWLPGDPDSPLAPGWKLEIGPDSGGSTQQGRSTQQGQEQQQPALEGQRSPRPEARQRARPEQPEQPHRSAQQQPEQPKQPPGQQSQPAAQTGWLSQLKLVATLTVGQVVVQSPMRLEWNWNPNVALSIRLGVLAAVAYFGWMLVLSLFFSLKEGAGADSAGIWRRVTKRASLALVTLEVFWRVWHAPSILLFLAAMWQQQAWLACCWLAIYAWARNGERDDSPLCWSQPQMALGCYFMARRMVTKFYLPAAQLLLPSQIVSQLARMIPAGLQGSHGIDVIVLILTSMILYDEMRDSRKNMPSIEEAVRQNGLPKFYSQFRYLCFALPAWHALSPLAEWLCAADPGAWGAHEALCLGAAASLWGLWVRMHLMSCKHKQDYPPDIPSELHQVGSERSSRQVWLLWAAQQLLVEPKRRVGGTHEERQWRNTLSQTGSPLLNEEEASQPLLEALSEALQLHGFRMRQLYVPTVGGADKQLHVWFTLVELPFLMWLTTFTQGAFYLIFAPCDLAILIWQLFSASWEQLSRCLTALMPARLPGFGRQEGAAWGDALVDATAAALLVGQKASALLAAGSRRLRRGCGVFTSALRSQLQRHPSRVQPAARRGSGSHAAVGEAPSPSRRQQQPQPPPEQQQQQGRASGKPRSAGRKSGAKKGQGAGAGQPREPQQPGILAAAALEPEQQPEPAPKSRPKPKNEGQALKASDSGTAAAQPAAASASGRVQRSNTHDFVAESAQTAAQPGSEAGGATGEPPSPQQRRPNSTSTASEAASLLSASAGRQAKGQELEKGAKGAEAGASRGEQQQQQQRQKPSAARASNPPLSAAQRAEASPPGQPAAALLQRQHPQQQPAAALQRQQPQRQPQRQEAVAAMPILQQLATATSQPAPTPVPPGNPLGAPTLPLPLHLEALEGADWGSPSAEAVPQTLATSLLPAAPSSSRPRYNPGLMQQQQGSQQQAAPRTGLAAPTAAAAQAAGTAAPALAAAAPIPLPVPLPEARGPSQPAGAMLVADTTEEEEEDGCVVCMEASPETVLVPCGHLCLCLRCSQSFGPAAKHQLCPVCREKVVQVVQVFQA